MNQSGISVPEDVKDLFHQARQDNNIRWIKLDIVGESIQVAGQQALESAFEQEFDTLKDSVVEKSSSYFVVRLDTQRNAEKGYDWLLILYVPDGSKVKQKMLMSSTAETLKSTLGNQYFLGTYHCTVPKELTYAEYKTGFVPKTEAHKYAEELRNDKERMNDEEKALGGYFDGPTKTNVKGLALPVKDDVTSSLQSFAESGCHFVSIKIVNETIELDQAVESVSPDEVKDTIGANDARFIFFRFAHEHNDNVIESVLMIYVCPGTAKVKERMIYSSSKTNIASLASQCGIKVEKNIELSEIADLSSDFLYNYLHASVTAPKESFSKPKRPTKKK